MKKKLKVKHIFIIIVGVGIIAIILQIVFSTINEGVRKENEKKEKEKIRLQYEQNQIALNEELASSIFTDDFGNETDSIIQDQRRKEITYEETKVIDVRVVQSELEYTIQYEPDQFAYEDKGEYDSYKSTYVDANAYVDIRLLKQEDYDREYKKIENSIEYEEKTKIGARQYETKLIHMKKVENSNPMINCFYVIENNYGYYYLIETNYYLQAQENLGKTIEKMLDTFTIK